MYNHYFVSVIESLRRKDEVIKQALIEKQSIVANILNIPKADVEHVTETTPDIPHVEKEPAELILTAIGHGKHPHFLNYPLFSRPRKNRNKELADDNRNTPDSSESTDRAGERGADGQRDGDSAGDAERERVGRLRGDRLPGAQGAHPQPRAGHSGLGPAARLQFPGLAAIAASREYNLVTFSY